MLQIGKYRMFSVNEGFLRLDGGAMFGVVPKTLWGRKNASDDKNRIEIALNILVLQSEEKTIIIDTGCGNKWNDKQRDIYQITSVENGLKGALLEAGIKSEDVTDVIYTHLHFDHAGGGTELKDDGSVGLTFENATYHVQKKQWEWALNPSEKDKASYFKDNLQPLVDSGKLNIIDGPIELFEGVTMAITDSHTIGHQAVIISDDENTVYHCGDIMPLAAHVKVPYVMAYDLIPLGTIKAKKDILENAAQKGWMVFFSHDLVNPMLTIEKTDRGFKGIPVESFDH